MLGFVPQPNLHWNYFLGLTQVLESFSLCSLCLCGSFSYPSNLMKQATSFPEPAKLTLQDA
jgi:hypothetical protein